MRIGNFDFGQDGTFIIAELSANHNGSLQNAIETIRAAKKAGADAIKLQTYRADTITLNSKNEEFIIKGTELWDDKNLYELYEEAYTPWEWHEELFRVAKEEGILCFSSPFDKTAVDLLETFNPPAYKIASFEITDYALIRFAASKGKPMIISTGVATIDEIQNAVDICRSEGNNDIILLQCTSAYPAPLEDANLKMIANLSETFGVISGFSDHTLGVIAPVVAVSLGARVIEKHFILDKSIPSADQAFSLDTAEFSQMVQAVRDTEKMLGRVDYTMSEKKLHNRRFCRSLYVSKPIKKGEIFTEENVKSVRPSNGLHPKYLNDILGKKAARDLEFASPLRMNDIKI
ncbi:MAG: pseudaminic acid synthase [Sulfurimonas sp.]|nr:pseudaminic acid synthase [Sulfurimonas sp.]MBU3938349.1 pseudaminic acid synthase [bacterium]MBU4025151.1 pseudaminic acid synthase [bacterium]MBU4057925.1 pseudaminic acid synthase [bacterium]MBU4109369.1 pseudaminic acid synthase [bacterium]